MLTLSRLNNPVKSQIKYIASLALWLVVLSLLIVSGACADMAIRPAVTPSTSPTITPSTSATSPFVLTAIPDIAVTVTAVRKLAPLSAEQAKPYLEVRDLVLGCDQFHPNRRVMVLQHLDWLTTPADVPAEFINLYGDDVSGQLVFGAVYMVAVEWKAGGRQADSCLIPIGDRLNTILVGLGQQPAPEFAAP
jgi:hypothetical protein